MKEETTTKKVVELQTEIAELQKKSETYGIEIEWNKLTGDDISTLSSYKRNIDANIELNNYGYHIDECQFNVRTPATLMNYKDNNNVTRALTGSVSLVLQLERSF